MSDERAPPGAKGASRWDPTGRDLAATQKQCSRGRKQLTGAECDELSALFAGAEMDLFGDKKGGLDPAIADCVIKQLRDKLWVSHCENEKLKEQQLVFKGTDLREIVEKIDHWAVGELKNKEAKIYQLEQENEKLKEEKYSLYAKWQERGEEIASLKDPSQ